MPEFDPELSARQLGPKGPGFILCKDLLPAEDYLAISQELARPDTPWYPNYTSFVDQEGREGQQAFDVFSHKLSRGSQELLDRLPAFRGLATFVTHQIVEPLQTFFPSLEGWQADEISAQRYPKEIGFLDWHRDNARHPGIIAILNTEGSARAYVESPKTMHLVGLEPGHVLLLRAPGLFAAALVHQDIRPRHTLAQVTAGESRTSVTIRANNRPGDPIRGFHYHNW